MFQKSVDNVTGVFIALSGFKQATFPKSSERKEKSNHLKSRVSTEIHPEKSLNGINLAENPTVKKAWDVENLEEKLTGNNLAEKAESRFIFSGAVKKHEPKPRGNNGNLAANGYNDYGIVESLKRPGVVYKKYHQ